MPLQPNRVGERVHRKCVCGGTFGAEEVDFSAESEHQVVVGERRYLLEADFMLCQVDGGDSCLPDRNVSLLVKEITQRMPYCRRLEQCGRHLVQHWLEGVVVVLVDEDDVDVNILQFPRRADTRESSAENQD